MISSDIRWFELLLAVFFNSASSAVLVVITACRRVINLALNGQTILQTEPPWASMKTEKQTKYTVSNENEEVRTNITFNL